MELSIIEQSPRLRRLYTQLCFCYEMNSDQKVDHLIQKLVEGLGELTKAIPWLAGQIINEGAAEDNTGSFRVTNYERIPCLVVKSYIEHGPMPAFSALMEAGFPFSMLKEHELCPRTTLSEGPGESENDPAPVTLLQANFVRGGLLLTITVSHMTMDIIGQVQMIRLLSKACQKQLFSIEEVHGGNLDRRSINSLLYGPEQERLRSNLKIEDEPTSSKDAESLHEQPHQPDLRWSYFKLQASKLLVLKASLTACMPQSSTFISTDDVVCAVLWAAIGRARISRLPPSTATTFIRQVDARRLLKVPEAYLGNMVTQAVTGLTLNALLDEPLSNIAVRLRSALDPSILEHQMRVHASKQARAQNKASGSPRDRSQMIVMSSWAKTRCYDLDFDLGLGNPIAVRRPAFTPVEGLVYLLPKAPQGDIVAGLCLRGDDMDKLEQDSDFLQYSQSIG